jgi:hypothetical protein
MGGIKLHAVFKPQVDENNIVSLFSKRSSPVKKYKPGYDSNKESESSEDEG